MAGGRGVFSSGPALRHQPRLLMRQLFVQVPRGQGAKVARAATDFDALNVAAFGADDAGGAPLDVVMVHLSNGSVGPFLDRLEKVPELRVSFMPQGVVALKPPPEEAPEQVKDVEVRSPIEVFLAGVQSVGSWTGLLGYAAAAGVVVWVGLYTNTIYLLTAAMLIAPFAGPAMNAALATASGDATLLGRSVLRYVGALAVMIGTTALLSLVLGHSMATAQMVARSNVSAVAVFLPLAAGAAGALNLVQSDRDSLVSGAAVGVLVAASLAPPAGLVGMAGVIGRWDLALSGFYVLVLQLVGINATGAVVFRLFGLSGGGARYERSRSWVFPLVTVFTALALAGLLYWQFADPIRFERGSVEQRAAAVVHAALAEHPAAAAVEVDARFARPDADVPPTLLATVYARRRPGAAVPDEQALSQDLARALQRRLHARWPQLTPFVSVTVLDAPAGPQ